MRQQVLIILAILVAACQSPATPTAHPAGQTTPTEERSPSPTLKVAQVTHSAKASVIPMATVTATFAPSPTWALTATPSIPPSPLPQLRHTPPTLMLHRSNSNFDAVEFLRQMVAILKEKEMRVVTYRDISAHPEITAAEQGKLFIITIDDLYLRYPIDKSVQEMIAILQEAGYPAVLGVVTESDYVYPETAETYKTLISQGWEIATHTDNHANLGQMEKSAPRAIYLELKDSMDKIEAATGVRPITLVLPEGQMVNEGKQLRRAELTWIVGINGGVTYDTARDLLYVGRDGPGGTAEQTFLNMLKRFLP